MMTLTWLDTLISAIHASGKSINSIALEAGVPQSTLQRIVNDGREPKLGTAERIAKVVGVQLKVKK